jgi:hypothetical protein
MNEAMKRLQELTDLRKKMAGEHTTIPKPVLVNIRPRTEEDEQRKQKKVDELKTRFTKLPEMIIDVLAAMKVIGNVPEELSIQSILGVINFAIHARYNIDPEFFGGNHIPSSLFLLGLAKTGGIKSTTYKMLGKGIDRFEEDERVRYKALMDDYTLRLAIYERANKKKMASLKEEDLDDDFAMADFHRNNTPPTKPATINYRLNKATVNGVLEVLENQAYVGLFSSEAGDFFNSYAFQDGRNSSKALEMLTTLTNAWDGHYLEKATGEKQMKAYNRRFNMLFLLQAKMAEDFLGNNLYSDQGFIHRILITQCDYWDIPDLDIDRLPAIEEAKAELEPFHDRIYHLLKQPLTYKENSNLELDPHIMKIENKFAIRLLTDFSNKIKNDKSGKYNDWAGFTARTFEHSLRLAATLAAFEMKVMIDKKSAEAAIELMEFYLEQRLGLEVGVKSRNPNQLTVADKVKSFITVKMGGRVLHNELTKKGPKAYRDLTVEEREGVMGELISRGEVRFVPDTNEYVIEEQETLE